MNTLLNELINYEPEDGFKNNKARRVYYMALESGRKNLARKIGSIYRTKYRSDLVVSTMILLNAIRRRP